MNCYGGRNGGLCTFCPVNFERGSSTHRGNCPDYRDYLRENAKRSKDRRKRQQKAG